MKMPEVQTVAPFSDGRCLVMYKDEEKTLRNIAYFSKKDSATYRDLLRRFKK